MKNTLSFLLYVFISILCICAFSSLPMNDNSQIREKYSSWSGVIRIWISDSTNASPAPWVNACSKDFEKLQNGVYINVQTVPASAIANMATDNPPDMIIWPSGLLDSPAGLAEITGEYPLRENLARSPYAVPLLTDAHAWIHSLPALPSDMENTPAACRKATSYP